MLDDRECSDEGTHEARAIDAGAVEVVVDRTCANEGENDLAVREASGHDVRAIERTFERAFERTFERAFDLALDPRTIVGRRATPVATPGAGGSTGGVIDATPRDEPRTPRTPLTPHALQLALQRHASFLRSSAWQLAWYDRDLRDDLEQEGRIALWRLDPVKVDAALHPAGYERAAIRHAMLRYLRVTARQDPGDRRIDWRIVEEVLETYGERRPGKKRAA